MKENNCRDNESEAGKKKKTKSCYFEPYALDLPRPPLTSPLRSGTHLQKERIKNNNNISFSIEIIHHSSCMIAAITREVGHWLRSLVA